jgi:hypothetical protein
MKGLCHQYMSLELGVGSNGVGLGVKIMPFRLREVL